MTQARFREAVGLHQQGRLAQAEALYEEILKTEPDQVDVLHLLGVVALQTKRYQRAVDFIGKAIERNPDSPEFHANYGLALRELARFDEAIASYDRAIRIKGNFAEAYNNRGVALKDLKRLSEAIVSYDRATAINPNFAEAYSNRGNALTELRQFTAALESYDRAIRAKPDHAKAHNNRGIALKELKRFAEAIASYDRAIAITPNFAEAHNNRGVALRELRRFAEAIASYDRAIAINPNFAEAYSNRGAVLRDLGKLGEAVADYERAIAIKPDSFAARACLAGLLVQRSGLAGARAEFDAAVTAMLADLRAGRFDEALLCESLLDYRVVRPIEDEAHAETCFAAWRDAMTEAGAAVAATLPPPPAAVQPRRDGEPPIVGFFLHAATLLGHVELVLDYLAAIRTGTGPKIEPRIYVFAGLHDGLREEARRRDLPVVFVDAEWPEGGAARPYQKMLWLRERLARDGVEALVWVSVPHFVHFGAALGVAPVNLFWALRFRPVLSPYIQGTVACASCFEREDRVNGRRWDVIPLAFQDLAGPPRAEEVAAIRHGLGDPPIVFASLARREKMQGKAWLEAVGLTLKACPDAVFLWTGRSEDPRIAGAWRDMGVAQQCHFVGWVDTRLYAQVLDIFLDTAPVGCGLTAMQAMAWGKPLVSFKDPLTNWGQCLAPVLDGRIADPTAKAAIEEIFSLGHGRDLLAWADTPQDYAMLAKRLTEDAAFRADVGTAGQRFTARYFATPAYAAERLCAIIRDTIAASRR